MFDDIEETLARELREVADDLHVPPMPPLPEQPRRPVRRRLALLAAAAAVVAVAGATGLLATLPGDRDVQPAQPSPAPSTSPSASPSTSPSPTAAPAPIPDGAPTVPYVLDRRLLVDGRPVPGDDWWSVTPAGEAWIAVRGMPITWWWGRGTEVHELPDGENVNPKISPDGRYVAVVRAENGEGILTVVDTESGQDVEGTPTSLGPVAWDEGASVAAVTDDGTVVVRRGDQYLTWSGDWTTGTSSGQMVYDATAAGVVAGDVDPGPEDGGPAYLAEISDTGALTKVRDLPEHDDLIVSPSGSWMAWTPIGTTRGDVTAVPSLQLQPLAGGDTVTLEAPDGWDFAVRTYAWEDDDHLVSVVSSAEQRQDRLARCSAEQARCVLVETD